MELFKRDRAKPEVFCMDRAVSWYGRKAWELDRDSNLITDINPAALPPPTGSYTNADPVFSSVKLLPHWVRVYKGLI